MVQKNSSCEVSYQDDTWALLKYENISLALVLPNSHPPHIAFEKDDAHKYGELKLHRDGTHQFMLEILLIMQLKC